LHYITIGTEKNSENRNIEIGKITHALKELAKKLKVPVLLLSQLNRASDNYSGAKVRAPRLSDLRDSGNIEQDADMVWFMHRPGYYKDSNIHPSETFVTVAKNRNGPTGEIELHFDLGAAKFSDKQTEFQPVPWIDN
jgi:replicative DNA helicase